MKAEETGMNTVKRLIGLGILFSLILSACAAIKEETTLTYTQEPPSNTGQPTTNERQLEIVTLLPFDAIPAIDQPEFLNAEQAGDEYAPDELVIGVEFNGDARAYSIPHLASHEIVNDTVGGVKIAVTW
jgi:hypothetical protein